MNEYYRESGQVKADEGSHFSDPSGAEIEVIGMKNIKRILGN